MSERTYEPGAEVFIICDVAGDASCPPSYFEHFEMPYQIERGRVVRYARRSELQEFDYVVENEGYDYYCQTRFLSPRVEGSAVARAQAAKLVSEMQNRWIGLCLPSVIEWGERCLSPQNRCWQRYNLARVTDSVRRVLLHMAAQHSCKVIDLCDRYPKEYGLKAYKKDLAKLAKKLGID